MPITDAEIEQLAEAAYAAWRATASTILPAWSRMPSWQRIRWRWAVEGESPEDMRDRCCVSITLPAWVDEAPRQRARWQRVYLAVARARAALRLQSA